LKADGEGIYKQQTKVSEFNKGRLTEFFDNIYDEASYKDEIDFKLKAIPEKVPEGWAAA